MTTVFIIPQCVVRCQGDCICIAPIRLGGKAIWRIQWIGQITRIFAPKIPYMLRYAPGLLNLELYQ